MDYSNPGLTPPRWTLTLHPDGSGHFHSERGNAPADSAESGDLPRLEAPGQERDVRVSATVCRAGLSVGAPTQMVQRGVREPHEGGLPGNWKKLSYAGPEGQGSCEYNYSKEKEIQAAGRLVDRGGRDDTGRREAGDAAAA